MTFNAILSVCAVLVLLSCKKDDQTKPDFKIEGLTEENYPNVDGSTSTQPLHVLIASELLDARYSWVKRDYYDGTWAIMPNYEDIPMEFFNERIKTSQTHHAIINLIDKKADLIFSARRMSDDEKAHANTAGVEVIETPIALDAFIFLANPANRVKSLTTKQIQDIYMGNIRNWQDVGGTNTPIVPFVRNQNSGSQELMESLVMKGMVMPEWQEELLGSMMMAFTSLRTEPRGISYTVYFYKEHIVREKEIKTIAVDGVAPNKQSIRNGTYPFVAEVYACIRGDLDRTSMAYKLYEYLQTDEGKELIALSGYLPI